MIMENLAQPLEVSAVKERIHYVHNHFLRDHPIHVTVIGAGGTGTMLLKELARMHYTLRSMDHQGLHVMVYDHDIVSESNIGKQLFLKEDVGQNKAICIVNKLNLAWGIDWKALPSKFNCHSLAFNIVISCVDSVSARKTIYNNISDLTPRVPSNAFTKPYYWIDCGNGADFGQVMLFTVRHTENTISSKYEVVSNIPYRGMFDDKVDAPDEPSCSLAMALGKQDLFINSAIAQVCAQMFWQLFYKKFITYKGVYLNLATMNTRPLPL